MSRYICSIKSHTPQIQTRHWLYSANVQIILISILDDIIYRSPFKRAGRAGRSISPHNTDRQQSFQVINLLNPTRDPRRLTRILYKSVRQQSITSWVDPTSIECPVCYNVMEQPVTTTCGHTFCRCCIKRTMQSRNMCPLCSSSLSDFYLAQVCSFL